MGMGRILFSPIVTNSFYWCGCMKKANPDEEEFFDKEEQDIYDIITGKVRYPAEPFRDEDVHPDLVIKIKVPNNQYVSRNAYLTLSNIMSSPSQRLERAYARAEKAIAREMEVNKQNLDPLNLKLRLQMAIKTIPVTEKTCKIINQHQQEEPLVLDCVHQFIGLLDSFSLMYNTILYMLQRICGFRVKAFILYDKHAIERHIYLFLSLSTKNLLRVANRYRIKKEVQYTHFDFYLNNPTTSDLRPIRLHSKFISDRQNVTQLKHISRFFKVKETAAKVQDIMEEVDLADDELENFRSCNEELHIVYEYLKYKRNPKLTNNEKMYLFEYNRRKLNPGVQKFYTTLKKRKQFFDISKEILPKYGYDSFEEPVVFQEFSLPDKNSRGATFFNKLENILLYKPLVCERDGKLTLFMNMQRTKLGYMLLKQHFKIGYFPLIGTDVFALENFFDKYGAQDPSSDIHGGLDGKCLVQNWNPYSLFSDIKVIRNYMGQRVAYQILYNNYVIGYMVSIIIPYVIFFVLEQVFEDSVWLFTSTLEAVLYAISYSAFMFYWESAENEFIKNYCDAVESKIFLSKFRGPYTRNVLTDQANQFRHPLGASAYIRNFLCFILIVVMLVILGAIFHGFRMMLVQIYQPLSSYQVGGALSLPHLIAYALFFIVEEGFRLVADKVISFMVYLQNPPSDEDQRKWQDTLTFFYLLAIEMIPPFFMLILEPFQNTSCYANSCEKQLSLYIYSRYVFVVGIVAVRLIYVIFFSYIRKNLQRLLRSKQAPRIFFQDKLTAMLKQAIDDSKKPEHKEKKMDILTSLQNYATYCTLLPISPGIVFLAVFIHFFSMRLSLIGDERRPLNRSESIIRFSNQLTYIYYLGILMNTWVNVYLLQFVEWNFQDAIFTIATEITEQGIFLLKVFSVIIYSLILLLLGKIGYMLARSASENVLNLRKDYKFKEYQHSRGGLKITLKKGEEMTPLKSVFRIFNPDETYDEMLERLQKEVEKDKGQSVDELGAAGSATSLEKKI